MLTPQDLLVWFQRHTIPEDTRALITQIRSSAPSRRVRGGKSNVCGRYPSRKMGVSIQFESHRVELAGIYEMEHDAGVLEYFDQPPPIKLRYESPRSRQLGVLHLSEVGILCGQRQLNYPSQGVFLSRTRPRFRLKAASREAALIEQGHENDDPVPAKDAHQAQLGSPPGAGGRHGVGCQQQERALGNRLLRHPANAEQPQGGNGDGQPQPGRSLRIGHAGALPLPAAAFGDLATLLNPRPQSIPTRLAGTSSQSRKF